jgi:hypothetical protein
VGWLLCLFGLAISLSYFCAEYAIYTLLAQPGLLPAGEAAAWIVSWILPVIIGLSIFPSLLFPTGRLPGRRWRWAAWLTAAFVLAGVISSAFSSGALLGTLGPIQNPLGIEGLTSVYRAILYVMSPLILVSAVLSLFARLHRAVGVERQQIKWFAYAASVSATSLAYLIPGLLDTPVWFERVGFALNIASIPAIPVSIGIAILRYRLYDIDFLINRTLVYGSLTTMLVALYFVGVAAIQAILQALTSREDSVKLRDETDLVALSNDLDGVVSETMQPAHVSLWLRPKASPKGEQAEHAWHAPV